MRNLNRTARRLAAILAVLVLNGSRAQARKLNPIDEGPRDASFLAFRNQLLDAVKRHDLQFINNILDTHVTTVFGIRGSIADFKREYEGKHARADLWKVLDTVLSLGGQFLGSDHFCAPYVATTFPADLQETDYKAIIGKNVRVRLRPSEAASVIDMLSYDLVKVDEQGSVPPDSDNPTWVKITTPSGRQGYVAGQYIRGFDDYQACFEKRRGRWWLTILTNTDPNGAPDADSRLGASHLLARRL